MLFLIAWLPLSEKKSSTGNKSRGKKKKKKDLAKQKCKLINQVSWRRVTRIKNSSSKRGRSLEYIDAEKF